VGFADAPEKSSEGKEVKVAAEYSTAYTILLTVTKWFAAADNNPSRGES
jgi:hypothetical protein